MVKVMNGVKLYPIGRWENIGHKLDTTICRIENRMYDICMEKGSDWAEHERLEARLEALEEAVSNGIHVFQNGMAYGDYNTYKICKDAIIGYDCGRR